MTWVRLDDGFVDHPKVADLSDGAFRFHVAALCYCARNLTDGRLDSRAIKIVAAACNTRPFKRVTELSNAGIWFKDDTEQGVFLINDYTDYNPTKEQVTAERKQAAERMRRLRDGRTNGERSPERSVARTGARSGTPSRPQSDSSKELGSSTTWQPAFGVSNPAEAIRRQITNGAIADRIDLEAELAAHPTLAQAERIALITLLEAKTAA